MTSLGQKTTNLLAGAAFSLAVLSPQLSNPAYAGDAADVTIRYGAQADVKRIERAAKRIEKRGVSVVIEAGLDDTGCAAVINKDGKEVFRFSPESIKSSKLGATAYRIGAGKGTGYTESDCGGSEVIASLDKS